MTYWQYKNNSINSFSALNSSSKSLYHNVLNQFEGNLTRKFKPNEIISWWSNIRIDGCETLSFKEKIFNFLTSCIYQQNVHIIEAVKSVQKIGLSPQKRKCLTFFSKLGKRELSVNDSLFRMHEYNLLSIHLTLPRSYLKGKEINNNEQVYIKFHQNNEISLDEMTHLGRASDQKITGLDLDHFYMIDVVATHQINKLPSPYVTNCTDYAYLEQAKKETIGISKMDCYNKCYIGLFSETYGYIDANNILQLEIKSSDSLCDQILYDDDKIGKMS